MAGRRMVYENMCDSLKFSKVSAAAERLWTRMLTKSDDNGNFHGSPALVRGYCLPQFDVSLADVQTWLNELSMAGLVTFYGNGERYVHFVDFEKFQKLRSDIRPTIKFPPHEPDAVEPPPQVDENNEFEPPRPGNDTPRTVLVTPRVENAPKDKLSKVEEKPSKANLEILAASLGTWKNLALRHKSHFGKKAAVHFQEKYLAACEQFTEEVVLACFDDWAPTAVDWVRRERVAHPLNAFFKHLPAEAADTLALTQAEDEERDRAAQERLKADQACQREEAAQQASIDRQLAEAAARIKLTPEQNEAPFEELL